MTDRDKLVRKVADRLARLASFGLPDEEAGLDLQSILADIPEPDRSAILNDAALLLKKRVRNGSTRLTRRSTAPASSPESARPKKSGPAVPEGGPQTLTDSLAAIDGGER